MDRGDVTSGEYIVNFLLPEWEDYFSEKQGDYQGAHQELGVAAQFVDINRKVVKLRRALWEGIPLTGEQPREILMDLIGHCFLTIDLLDEEANAVEAQAETPTIIATLVVDE